MARRRSTGKRNRNRGAVGLFLLVLLLVLLAGAVAVAWTVMIPFGSEREVFVEIPTGSTTTHIARQLEEAGVVRSSLAFDLVRLWKRGALHAGEYRFNQPSTVVEVYARILRGDVYTRPVTIPEGFTLYDIASRLNQAGFDGDDFLHAAKTQLQLVADLDPQATSLEGYLFPDTYQLPRRASAAQICATMVRRFKSAAAQLGIKENFHRVVTIASLVERETAVDADRALVASVFVNRLQKGMALMTDPSVIYGLRLEGRWRGTIYKSDLGYDTPYNTYLHVGLPPGPIANPGLPSLRAAFAPAPSDYLYFVAAGTNAQGASRFSRTIDEQSHNVAVYRHAIKKAGKR